MIRLTIAILLFLAALLTVCKAPEFYIWMFAIVVTEFSWLFALIAIVVFGWGFGSGKYQIAGSILAGISFLLFLSPIVRGYLVAGELKTGITQTFPTETVQESSPISFFKLFKSTSEVKYKQITYAKYADTSLSLDFYPATTSGKRPCVIVVHGGSWSRGDSQQLPELNSILAEKGYQVAAINYRLAPKYRNPAAAEDVGQCIKYLKQNAAELNIDTNKFFLLGRSAGAQIALLAAYTLNDKHIKGAIDYYGPIDMVWGYSIPSNPLIMDSRKVMSDYIGGTYPQVPDKYKASSPLEFVNKTSPPTLIIHGGNDVLVAEEHSRRLNERLQQNGIPHYWLKLPWATHGFDYVINGPGGQLSTYAVLQFLNSLSR